MPLGAASLLGAWSVERRAPGSSAGAVRFTFYRDARFGALGDDGRATLWGSWQLDEVRPLDGDSAALAGRLALRYDHVPARSGVYRATFAAPPHGPVLLTAEPGVAPARLELTRALALDAALIGTWQAPTGTPYRGESALDALHLRRDGAFAARLGNGATRAGRWAFERLGGAALNSLVGTLVLDPAERVYPVERWTVTRLQDAGPPALLLHLPTTADARPTRLEQQTLDPLARPLVATWRRFTSAATTRVPQEFTLHADGSLDALARAGTPRITGRWSIASLRRGPDRVFAVVAVVLRPFGQGAEQDRWHVVLPFARNAELEVYSERDGGTARCRRLFR